MLSFTNRFLNTLPGAPNLNNHSRQVHGAFWSRVTPARVAAPSLLLHSPEVAAMLGLSDAQMRSPEMLAALSGNGLLPGMETYATAYAGHQFGNWAGQLGDGRAILLGEAVAPSGEHFELQLKGAGPTPYSRRADGRAVLRSSIREFLCSEAMFHLGVPTTRALSLVATGDEVLRETVARVRTVLRESEIFARIGGEEFAVFIPGVTRENAIVLAERVRVAIDHQHALDRCLGDPEVKPQVIAWVGVWLPAATSTMMASWMWWLVRQATTERCHRFHPKPKAKC